MRFIEKFGALDALCCLASGESVRFGFKAISARVVEQLAAYIGWQINAEQLSFGHVTYSTGIRERAYRAAERKIDNLPGERWANSLAQQINVDLWLITRKFFFDDFYNKFEFFELAIRYTEENSSDPLLLIADFAEDSTFKDRLNLHFRTQQRENTSTLGIATIFLLPVFLEFFYLRKGQQKNLSFNSMVICEVDGPATYDMFSTLFEGFPLDRLAYVCEARNSGALLGRPVSTLRLDKAGLAHLRRAVWNFLGTSLLHVVEISCYGSRLFRLFYLLMQGRAETVGGTGNLYCTYEHLITYKAVRNSFLERQGSRTLFVPLNAHVTPQFFHSEILINYTLMCAAGRHTETLYRMKRDLIQQYLPTGSYASHRRGLHFGDPSARRSALENFKGDALCVVIVSPGICDPTYTHELKLMSLARKLSVMPGVKVIVRLKPVAPAPKYTDFYQLELDGHCNVLVTAAEYDLFDFIDVGDLFVTSISNAAFDLAQAGAIVMFIDYLRDPDMLLPWRTIPEVCVEEQRALPTIQRWLRDEPGERNFWHETMGRFRKHIDYRHANIEAYRENFQCLIAPFLPEGLTPLNLREDV